MTCYFCNQPITGPAEHHHPDKRNHPDWTEPAHPECHARYHREANHFQEWGARSPYAGREGYERAVARWPAFHSMGGKARARSARRDERGRFVAETKPFYGLGAPFQTPSAHVRQAWHEHVQAQTRKMTAGPFLAEDGHTLVVPSEWYHEDAARFWKSHGFEWRPKSATWQRDTRRPFRGKRYPRFHLFP